MRREGDGPSREESRGGRHPVMIPCCQERERCEESRVRGDSPRHDMMVIRDGGDGGGETTDTRRAVVQSQSLNVITWG